MDRTKKKIPVPFDANDVTEAWMETALTCSSNNVREAKVTAFHKEGLQENGYLSSIFRAVIVAKGENDGKEEEFPVFVKIMPADDEHRFLINTSFMDVTEIESYRILFADLATFELEQQQNKNKKEGDSSSAEITTSLVPTFHCGGYDKDEKRRAYFLMLADLTPSGYRMMDFNAGLSLAQLTRSLEALAHFHAAAFSYGKVAAGGVRFVEKYEDFLSRFFHNFEFDPDLKNFMEMNMDLVEKDLVKEGREDLLGLVRKVRKDVGTKFKRVLLSGDDRGDFLIHGDLWANNVMFDKEDRCKIVDWQFTAVGSIFLDIGTMAFYSMNPAETEKNLEAILDAYYSRFKSVCEGLGAGGHVPWTREGFGRKAEELGLFMAFLWCSTSYELVGKYPALKDRAFWCLERSARKAPHFYQ